MKSIIDRSVVRSAEDPNKRNRRINFDNHTDVLLDKQDDILGMPQRNRIKRGRKPKNQPQEPISTRTRSQGIANTASTSEIIEDLKDTYYTDHQPTNPHQNTP